MIENKIIQAKDLAFYQAFKVPVTGFNEPVYLEYKNKLHQAYIVKIYFSVNVLNSYGYTMNDKMNNIMVLKVAGIGEINVPYHNVYGQVPIHESIEQFKERKFVETTRVNAYDAISSAYVNTYNENIGTFQKVGFQNGTGYNYLRYRWTGIKCVPCYVDINSYVVYDNNNGFHFEELCYQDETYNTSKACKDDNEMNIVNFENVEDAKPVNGYSLFIFGVNVNNVSEEQVTKIKELLNIV